MSTPDRREWRVVLAATVVLTLVWTAPWLPYLRDGLPDAALSGRVVDGADARLVVWAIAWQAHAAATRPLEFLDANIFHPATGMLTGSDTFLSAALLAAPIFYVTGNALLAANVVALLGYGLCFLLTYVVVRRTGSEPVASAIAGIAVALGPFRVPADVHALQYPSWILPLVLLACFRVEARNRWLLASLAVLFAVFASFYMAALALLLLCVEVVLVALRAGVPRAVRLGLTALPGLLLLGLFALPWLARGGEIGTAPADLRASFELVGRIFQPAYLDPSDPMVGVGWAVAALAGLGLLEPLFARRASVEWSRWVLLFVVGAIFAVGPALRIGDLSVPMPYAILVETPVRALRAFPRFFILAQFGLAGLAARGAGLALRGARERVGGGVHLGLAALLVLAVLLPRSVALWQTRFSHLPVGAHAPAVYDRLAQGEAGPLLEVPGPWGALALQRKLVQAEFMVQSTNHWRPLLGGHTGYPPWWWAWLRREVYLVPEEPSSLQALVDATGVKWILVHRAYMGAGDWKRWRDGAAQQEALEEVVATDDHLLLHVALDPTRPWQERLRAGVVREDETILGTSRAPLESEQVSGELELVAGPRSVPGGGSLAIHLVVRNHGEAAWPALAVPDASDDGLVSFEMQWVGANGQPVGPPVTRRLMRDVFAGEAQQNWLDLVAPTDPGVYTLRISLRQVGSAAFDSVAPLRVPIAVRPG